MPSQFPLFDRRRLRLQPLAARVHDLDVSAVKELRPVEDVPEKLMAVGRAVMEARKNNRPVILMMGAHVIRSGVQRYIIDLMERGLISALAGNGACAIHDFELARIGATTESVARYIREGQFGLWDESGEILAAFECGVSQGQGAGEALGRFIYNSDFPYKDISLFAAAHRLGIPFTVHLGIGHDIISEHPTCSGAILGAASYTDFLIFTAMMENMEGGVFCNFGSAITGPEVFLKALAMARNANPNAGPRRFTSLVCDVHDLPENTLTEADRSDPRYYFRPWKTILSRSVESGGQAFYVKGKHHETIPALWTGLRPAPSDA